MNEWMNEINILLILIIHFPNLKKNKQKKNT